MTAAYFKSFYRTQYLIPSLTDVVQEHRAEDQEVKERILKDGIRTNSYTRYESQDLQALGWELVSSECLRHLDLPRKFIKLNGSHENVSKSIRSGENEFKPGPRDNLYRPYYAEKVRAGMRKLGMSPHVPRKYIVHIRENDYVTVSEEIDIMSKEECLDHWGKLHREGKLQETVKKICQLIKMTALVDANITNICFTKSGEIAVIDTEPMGLFSRTSYSPYENSIRKIDQYIQGGLSQLKCSFEDKMGGRKVTYEDSLWKEAKARGAVYSIGTYDKKALIPSEEKYRPILEAFKQAVDEEIKAYEDTPWESKEKEIRNSTAISTKWNWSLIIASILILPPLLLAIYSLFKTVCYFPRREPDALNSVFYTGTLQ